MIDSIISILESIDKSNIKIDKTRYTYNDIPVPSVTQILSKCISEDYLLRWSNHLGFKHLKYQDQLNLAAAIGTEGHNRVEDFLKNGIECDNVPYIGFRLWWDVLNANHSVKILGIEESLVLPYCAGTYDILLSIDGKTYLIDLKTSNNVGYKYFIQLAAYRHMIYTLKGINIDGCIILQLDKNKPMFREYVLDLSNTKHYEFIEHCASTFMSLVLSYYSINEAERSFKSIF